MKKKSLISFILSLLAFSHCAGQSKVDYTHWTLAHILTDYEASPVYSAFITGGPVIERLDSIGGSLLFYLTPQSNHDCRQAFRVGWQFDQPVSDLEEGMTVNVSIFNYPVVDSAVQLLDCFRTSDEVTATDDGLTIRFIGGDSIGLSGKSDLAFYWDASSLERFKLKDQVTATSMFGDSEGTMQQSSGSFLVQDLGKSMVRPEIPFGTFAFEIGKKNVFTFRVLYLYDAMESAVSPAGAHRLLMDKLVVEHTLAAGKAEPVMNIILTGILEEAIGRELQITVHPFDSYRRPMPAIQGDTAFCDRSGYVVAYSQVMRVPDRQFYLDRMIITIPYYSLNLPTTQSGHLINLYAEVFLDGKSIGMSRMAQTTFFW